MKKLLAPLMLTGLLFAGAACGSDSKSTDTDSETTVADSSGDTSGDSSGGSSNADVANYCKQAEDLATQLKAVMADPTKGDVAAVTKQAQDLVAAAAQLTSANADDVDEITACSQKISAAMGG